MAGKIRFSINKETLFRNETEGFILTKVPNSRGKNYVAFNKESLVAENDRTYIMEMDADAQIAMWKGEPHMAYAEAAQTHDDYTNQNVVRISAEDLYAGYYKYSKKSDPSVKKRRQEIEEQYDRQTDKKEVSKEKEENTTDKQGAQQETVAMNQDAKAEEKKPEIKHFDNQQMAEILKGMMQGVDVKQYKNVEMDAAKMKELRLGLRAGINVSPWNNKDISAQAMRELRLGARKLLDIKDIDISKYNAEQLQELRLGLQQNLDVNKYLNSEYDAGQMHELRLGLKAGVDISKYQDIHFTTEQMQMLRHRLVFQHIVEILSVC